MTVPWQTTASSDQVVSAVRWRSKRTLITAPARRPRSVPGGDR